MSKQKIEETNSAASWAAWAFLVLLVAIGAAYRGSLSTPFIFDDRTSITENPTIRDIHALGQVLSPPVASGAGVAGRPLVNLSLALNYAQGGLNVRWYHETNLLIHFLAALTLFGITRHLLKRSGLFKDPAKAPVDTNLLATVIALVWLVHPLLTESVTFVTQRTESLMGFFYLFTLYSFICGSEAPSRSIRSRSWFALSWITCLCGMATKEVMATAPLMILLCDRTFYSGSFAQAWKARSRYYVALALTWLLLGYLVIQAGGDRGGAAGFGTGIGVGSYLMTQCRAILLYLKLSFWPSPLVVDYGTGVITQPLQVALYGLVLLLLLVGTVIALIRRPLLGFLGAWFFVILAPSSSIIPLTGQTIAEHRMYLPLAAIVALVFILLWRWIGRMSLCVGLAIAVGFCFMTSERNEAYASDLSIWTDTVAKVPENARAQYNLANELSRIPGRLAEAVPHYESAISLNPNYADAENNLGLALAALGRPAEAIGHYRRALAIAPGLEDALNNLGVALAKGGKQQEALETFQTLLRLEPNSGRTHEHVALTLSNLGRYTEAIPEYLAALRIGPASADMAYNLGVAQRATGHVSEAVDAYKVAVQLRPDFMLARNNLGIALVELNRLPEAIVQFQAAVRSHPEDASSHRNLGVALRAAGDSADAQAQLDLAASLTEKSSVPAP